MEQTVFQLAFDGFLQFLHNVNWLFVVIFVILTWLMNEGADSTHTATKWMNWLNTFPVVKNKAFRALFFGALMAWPFSWLYDVHGKEDIAKIINGIIVGMAVWKIGIDLIIETIKKKWFPKANEPASPVIP